MYTHGTTAATLGWLAAALVSLVPAAPCPAEGFPAVTKPSADMVLSFVRPGLIDQVAVKEGQFVKAGEPLVALDDRAERAQLAFLKAQYEDTTAKQAAEAQLRLARIDLERTQKAAAKGAATPSELGRAQLEKEIADLRYHLSIFEKDQAKLRHEAERLQLERMRKLSPISGRVEEVRVEVGESVDALMPVVRVVQIDPLWINVGVPVAAGTGFKLGQRASVRIDSTQYKKPPSFPPLTGKVIYIATVADPGSNKLRVRVELPNPKRVLAGLHVLVEFPPAERAKTPKASAAAARKTQPKGELNVSKGNHAGKQ